MERYGVHEAARFAGRIFDIHIYLDAILLGAIAHIYGYVEQSAVH